MVTGTESETKAFMAVCIETAKRYNLDDYRTPVFIFERLCSIIYPVSGSSLLLLFHQKGTHTFYFNKQTFY